jgi:hypothetical protein
VNKYFYILATGPAMRYRLNSGLYYIEYQFCCLQLFTQSALLNIIHQYSLITQKAILLTFN